MEPTTRRLKLLHAMFKNMRHAQIFATSSDLQTVAVLCNRGFVFSSLDLAAKGTEAKPSMSNRSIEPGTGGLYCLHCSFSSGLRSWGNAADEEVSGVNQLE